MSKWQRVSLFLLRVSLGWLFLYAGLSKLATPGWSAAGFLQGAKTFIGFYAWFLQPSVLPAINFINEWGLTLLGVSLILGIFVRLSSALGIILMLLYYFPRLQGVHPDPNSFIVDQHIVFIFVLLVLMAWRAGRVWGLDKWCSQLPFCARYPRLRQILG